MRHGLSVSVSLAIGMAIFVLAVASTFLILQGDILPSNGFSSQMSSAADYALAQFHAQTDWTVHRQPVIIHSDTAVTDEPLEVTVPFPPQVVKNSVVYTDQGTEIASQNDVEANTSVIITNVSAGTTLVNLVYTVNTDLPAHSIPSSLNQAGNSTWNNKINVTFSDTGFEQISFNGTNILASNASIGASSYPRFNTGVLLANVTYNEPDRKEVHVFDRTGKMRIHELFTGQAVWTFNLTSAYTSMYTSDTGSTTDLGSAGTIYAGTTDFVDFYNTTGFAIIGNNMFVNVSRPSTSSPINVRINTSDTNGKKDFVLYAHTGNYTQAIPQYRVFTDPYNVSVGLPITLTGTSRQKAETFAAHSYKQIQDTLGLVGSNYNITVPGVFEAGTRVTGQTAVHVFEFPIPILSRFGNVTVNELRMRVWSQ